MNLQNPTKCLCCNSDSIQKMRVMRGYQSYRCCNCFFEFIFPIPDKAIIEKYYNTTTVTSDIRHRIQDYIRDITSNPNSPKRDWFDKVLAKSIETTSKNSLDILEIGSSYGYFIHYANTKGHRAIGIESTPDYAKASEGLINGKVVYIEDFNYLAVTQNKKVDLLYIEHVFEHVLEPDKVLAGIKNVLDANSLLFMVVPNSRGFLFRLLGSLWPWASPPDHLYFYNKVSLEKLFSRYDISIIDSWTSDYYFRSIPQFYSLVPFINIFIAAKNKIVGTKTSMMKYHYRYPTDILSFVMLLPYWVFYPIIKIGSELVGYNELVVLASKKK